MSLQLDPVATALSRLTPGGVRPLEMRFPDYLVKRMLKRYSDVELTRVFLRRLRDMGATAVVVTTDPLTDDRVFKVEWPDDAAHRAAPPV